MSACPHCGVILTAQEYGAGTCPICGDDWHGSGVPVTPRDPEDDQNPYRSPNADGELDSPAAQGLPVREAIRHGAHLGANTMGVGMAIALFVWNVPTQLLANEPFFGVILLSMTGVGTGLLGGGAVGIVCGIVLAVLGRYLRNPATSLLWTSTIVMVLADGALAGWYAVYIFGRIDPPLSPRAIIVLFGAAMCAGVAAGLLSSRWFTRKYCCLIAEYVRPSRRE